MPLDPIKESERIRGAFRNSPGNDFLDNEWKWNEAKLVAGTGKIPDTILIPAKYPKKTPDLRLAAIEDIPKLTDSVTRAEGIMDHRNWELTLPTVESQRSQFMSSVDKEKTIAQNLKSSILKGKDFKERAEFYLDAELEGKALHELEHSIGGSEYRGISRQTKHLADCGFEGVNSPKDVILASVASLYDARAYGGSLADAVDFKPLDPLVKEMKPGGASLSYLLINSKIDTIAQLSDPKIDQATREALSKRFLRLTAMINGDPQVLDEFKQGFAEKVAENYARGIAKSIGMEPKDIANFLTDNTSSYSVEDQKKFQFLKMIQNQRRRSTLLLLM